MGRNPDQTQESEKASMKAPPKRKGNLGGVLGGVKTALGLNESPSKKEGKCGVPIAPLEGWFSPQ